MEIIYTCPLGSECEEIKNNKLYRCRWFQNIKGKDPQSDELIDRWDCSLTWHNVIGVEQVQTNRGQTAALESFRNEVVNGQQQFNNLFAASCEKKLLIETMKKRGKR